MNYLLSAGIASWMAISSMAQALPSVTREIPLESRDARKVMMDLKNYQQNYWAIGLNGDTLQVDQFQKFFAQRRLPFAYYVQSMGGVSIGEYSAYEQNMNVLRNYEARIIQQELAEISQIKRFLKAAEGQSRPVGFTGVNSSPDRVIAFFAERGLTFTPLLVGQSYIPGDQNSYARNMSALNRYENQLRQLLASIPQINEMETTLDEVPPVSIGAS